MDPNPQQKQKKEEEEEMLAATSGQEFKLGRTASEVEKKKVKPEEKAEQRIKQTFNMGGTNESEELKRKREDFAVQLRKKKKEEMFKQKRAFTGDGATNTPSGATNQQQNAATIMQAQATPQLQLPLTGGAALGQPLGAAGSAQDDTLLDISIEQALQTAETVSLADFILMAQRMVFRIQDFQKLLTLVQDANSVINVIFATIGFRRLLSQERNPPIQQVIDANLVPRFLGFLQKGDFPKLQFEAAWCLTNLASGTNDQVQVLIEKGAIKQLVELLSSPHVEVIEQAIWGLGNIAGDSHKIRDLVISENAILPIASILDRAQPGSSFVRNASWTLSNLCRGRPAPNFAKVVRAVPSLAKVLIENDVEDILIDVCWAMSYLSDGGEERIPCILDTGVLPRLVQLLQHPNIAISVPCLRTIGNIVTGSDEQTQLVIEAGALQALNELIYNKKKTVRKEVCWSLSNITAGSSDQIQLCIDMGIVDKLIHLLVADDTEIKKEAVWAVSNCTASANFTQFNVIVEKGIIKALLSVLKMNEARVLAVALEGLDNVLKAGQEHFAAQGVENRFAIQLENDGGLELIEGLQMHPNHQIYQRALKILEGYFQDENDGLMLDATADNNAPQSASSQMQFQF